jgi:hypothetical protein
VKKGKEKGAESRKGKEEKGEERKRKRKNTHKELDGKGGKSG